MTERAEIKEELTIYDDLLAHLFIVHAAATHAIYQARAHVPELGTSLACWDAPGQMALG